MSKWWSNVVACGLLAAGFLAVVTLTYSAAIVDKTFGLTALFILIGLAAFIMLLLYTASGLSAIGASDPAQAFGLPPGTLRAVLTLAFIVLVGVFGSYILSSTATRGPYAKAFSAQCVPAADSDQVAERWKKESSKLLVVARPMTDEQCKGVAGPREVTAYVEADYRSADENAKTILTILSTLLSAMIGFYFGSSGRDDAKGDPDRVKRITAIEAAKAEAGDLEALGRQIDDLKAKVDVAQDYAKKQADQAALADARKTLALARAELASAVDQAQDASISTSAHIAAERKANKSLETVKGVRKLMNEIEKRQASP